MKTASPATMDLRGRRVTVMGLGRFGGGVGVTRWLCAQGAQVTVTDLAPAAQLAASLAQLDGLHVRFTLGRHTLSDFTATDLVVANPAVDRAQSEFVNAALQAGVPLTSEMNLFVARCPALTVGITGSVGKSTTTMLTYLALQAALHDGPTTPAPHVYLGGNIGRSLLLELPALTPRDVVVLELSSFMLEETPQVAWSPQVAVVTNVRPNHLDRHGTLEDYAAAKRNILRYQEPDDVALLNGDDPVVSEWTRLTRGKSALFTTQGATLPLLLPGAHNQSNARAALAVLDHLPRTDLGPLDQAAGAAAIQSFPGLAHRLQLVHTSTAGGRVIRWFNDSKATSPDAALTALAAFPARTAVCIVGGYDKHSDMAAFTQLLATHAGGVLGIGQTGPTLVAAVQAAPDGPPAEFVETLDRAVTQAEARARQIAGTPATEAVVLLSPACASWGQFANYEQRGDRFALLARHFA